MTERKDRSRSRSPAFGRRPRAPTITLDTTAGDNATNTRNSSQERPIELRPTASFESNRSKPTSPHNVSSPTHNESNNFLAVPGTRSRANSAGSSQSAHTPQSSNEDTLMNSSPSTTTASGVKPPPKTEDDDEILNDQQALKPDPGTEQDFQVPDNKFAFSPGQLNKLLNPKSLGAFHALGGLQGLLKGLRTDRNSGLSSDEQHLEGSVSFEEAVRGSNASSPDSDPKIRAHTDLVAGAPKSTESSFADRKKVFSDNRLPERKSKSIFELAWIAYNDKVLILLTVAAVISLGLGLYQTFGQEHEPGEPQVEWVEGVAIVVAILIVVVVGAANDWQKERQFVKLNKKKEDRTVKVIRSGKTQEISVYDILVGDIVLLEPGDMIPVDGIFIEGSGVKCDESSATGESDLLRKTAADEVFRAIEARENVKKLDPFIISGAKVTEGIGKFVVTSTGINSSFGKTMMSLREGNEVTPLQRKLNVLAEYIAKLGGSAALLLFVVLLIKFLAALPGNTASSADKAQNFLDILIVAVTVVVVAVPEGLPLAVTLALAFATTRMLRDNNLVRVLRSCETMGNATTICSDKTGTLTQNKMTVVAGTLGISSRFGDAKGKVAGEDHADDVSVPEFVKVLSEDTKDLLEQSIVINSTAFEAEEDGKQTFVGSKTETALLTFARDYLGMGPINVERANADTVQVIPFDSARKCMGAVVKLANGKYRLYVKGASEILLGRSSRIIADPTGHLSDVELTGEHKEALNDIITTYASRSLRTIAFLYKDFEEWPPRGAKRQDGDPKLADFDDVNQDMVFLGVVGIQDPLRPGVPKAVEDCRRAGVKVRMVTGDNMLTAKAIATECGIYTEGGLIMEGPTFRQLSNRQKDEIIPSLQVLARSSPDDKRILVKRLKERGETVAVTGDGTNDAPALKAADVGFSMGIAGTEVAKEASAIILMDDNFTSIVKALMWGRAVNDAVQKFLQFQITVNITAVLLTFISAVSSDREESVLTAVQLLWVNLIMDTLAALALATDPPTPSIIDRPPTPKSAGLITLNMWKMIIGQAIYQLTVTLVLYFAGASIFGYTTEREIDEELPSLVFNSFVWMQIFNQVNNRRLDNKFNILEGAHRNWFFIGIFCIMCGGQVLIIFVGGAALSVVPLNGTQWAVSVIIGIVSIPVGVIIRLIPDELIARCIPDYFKRRKAPDVSVEDDDHYEWNPALLEIKEELTFLRKWRGGRLNQFTYKVKHPKETIQGYTRAASRSRSNSSLKQPLTPPNGAAGEASQLAPPSPVQPSPVSRRRGRSRASSGFGPAAAMAGIVAGSIAGWSPVPREGENDSLPFSRENPRKDLESRPGVEVHPATKPNDPVIDESLQPPPPLKK